SVTGARSQSNGDKWSGRGRSGEPSRTLGRQGAARLAAPTGTWGGKIMGNDMMDLHQLATYLQRDAREVRRMASRGYLPGHKVSGEWRFHPAEINHWIETQMHAYTEQELTALETGPEHAAEQPMLSGLLTESTIAVPLMAS